MATGSFLNKQGKALYAQQVRAWRFYGIPWPENTRKKRKTADEPVGEVGYVVEWMAEQMSRMGWTITVDGEETWTVTLPATKDKDGNEVAGERVTVVADDDGDSLRDGSKKVLDLIGWGPNTVRQIMVNMFVAGQFDYVAEAGKGADETKWRVISVVHPDRDEIIEKALHTVPGLWPHPANPDLPNAPLFRVLPVLEDMAWLSRLSRSQSASRIAMRGILGVADGMSFANGGNFWDELLKSITARMEDPTDVSPLVLRGAKELVASSAGGGMGGLSWVIPEFPYDNKIDEKVTRLINRLAYGLPIPPEILLGLSNQSRATAFQVEENSYRAHVEPPANLLAAIAAAAVSILLPDSKIDVHPDPTELLARRHSVQDAKDALAVCAIGFAYFRQVLGIPEEAAPDAAELALLLTVFGKGTQSIEKDPANVADQEPVNASVGGPKDEPLTEPELNRLSDLLAAIDQTLLMELGGATQQATDRARFTVGARTRTFTGLRDAVPKNVSNERVAAHLGVQVLNDTGVPIQDIVTEVLAPLLTWWETRIRAARVDVVDILGPEAEGALDDSFLLASVDVLADLMAAHIIDTLESEAATPLDALARRTVMAVAGGARR